MALMSVKDDVARVNPMYAENIERMYRHYRVNRMTSTALDSYGIVIIEFDFEKDLQQATQDIRDKISETRADLPPEMEEPIISRFDPQDFPIMSMTLSSESHTPAELSRLGEPPCSRSPSWATARTAP